jgi:hypothetical protein
MDACFDVLRCWGVDFDRRNVGGLYTPSGKYVRFNHVGDADITGTLPRSFGAAAGRRIEIECKHSRFDPSRLGHGAAREHFDRQLARLHAVNEAGGFGFWCTDASQVLHVLERVREGWHVTIEGDFPFLTTDGS